MNLRFNTRLVTTHSLHRYRILQHRIRPRSQAPATRAFLHANVLGMNEQKAKKINQRKYVEYVLRNGTMEEKRGLLGSLKNRLVLKQGDIQMEESHG